MKTFRYHLAQECKNDKELMDQIDYFDRLSPRNADPCSIDSRLPFTDVEIPTSILTQNASNYIHAVEADREGDNIKIRIIVKQQQGIRGVNVVIPHARDRIMYQKYRDLRFLIRNQDAIYVTFPKLYVMALRNVRGLYLMAHDFKVYDADNSNESANSCQDDDWLCDFSDNEPPKPRIMI